MKKVYLLFAALLGMVAGAKAQILADMSVVLVAPTGTSADPFSIPCTDSFDYEIILINNGPGTIGATDTVYFVSPWAAEGYINYTTHGNAAVPANDTIVHYAGKTHRNEIDRLYDVNDQSAVYAPFSDGDYIYAVIAAGFSSDTTVIKDPDNSNNADAALVNINCSTGISFNGKAKQTLQLFPNPATDEVRMRANMSNGNATVRVTDIAGRTVMIKDFGKQSSGNTELMLDIAALNDGLYYVELTNGDKRSVNKLSVQRK